ncbi:hypothetical protein SAMN02799630_01207 [Paenibacillus sp. UNCCL117]|nr:hypothetical protein SAMN04488602_103185 [Paenibacillus sp. cl123]SFW23948.1 hypothetical protein SAMN02799630_01207 [Paenibacillus sp. UNCCL117]
MTLNSVIMAIIWGQLIVAALCGLRVWVCLRRLKDKNRYGGEQE